MRLKSLSLLIVIISIMVSTTRHDVYSQESSTTFVEVNSIELLEWDTSSIRFAITNDTSYIFDCDFDTCYLTERLTRQGIPDFWLPAVVENSGWSLYSTYFATMNSRQNCTAAGEENLLIFNSQDATVVRACLPYYNPSLTWSPFSDTTLLIGERFLFDAVSQNLEPVSAPAPPSIDDLSNYIGYGSYLWDQTTQRPVAIVRRRGRTSDDNINHALIVESTFEMCPVDQDRINCVDIFDTLDIANVDVFDWRLHGNYLVWAGHESASGEPLQTSWYPLSIFDTVIFLTDLSTQETQEVFRFSSLSWDTKQVFALDWLPNGQTIALALRLNFDLRSTAMIPTLSPDGSTPVTYLVGTLLIHLDWLTTPP